MKQSIQLMTTLGCHLCEQALAMWNYLKESQIDLFKDFELSECEISEDESLVERYGLTIPVLVYGKHELDWPFEPEDIYRWLADIKKPGPKAGH